MNPSTLALGYTGAFEDAVTGGYPLGHGYRHYLPALMRFNAPGDWSPFGAGGINPYAYCAGDPVNHVDPSGHFHLGWQAWLGIGLGAFAVAAAPFTGGASITGVLAAASGVTAIGSGVASGFGSPGAHKASSMLGWVSLGAGLFGGASDLLAMGGTESAEGTAGALTLSGRFVGDAEPRNVLSGDRPGTSAASAQDAAETGASTARAHAGETSEPGSGSQQAADLQALSNYERILATTRAMGQEVVARELNEVESRMRSELTRIFHRGEPSMCDLWMRRDFTALNARVDTFRAEFGVWPEIAILRPYDYTLTRIEQHMTRRDLGRPDLITHHHRLWHEIDYYYRLLRDAWSVHPDNIFRAVGAAEED